MHAHTHILICRYPTVQFRRVKSVEDLKRHHKKSSQKYSMKVAAILVLDQLDHLSPRDAVNIKYKMNNEASPEPLFFNKKVYIFVYFNLAGKIGAGAFQPARAEAASVLHYGPQQERYCSPIVTGLQTI